MKKVTSFILSGCTVYFLLLTTSLSAQQHNLQSLLNQVKPPKAGSANTTTLKPLTQTNIHLSQLFIFQEKCKTLKLSSFRNTKRLTGTSDTIYVGVTPNDTLTITGTYTHTGPIVVVLNGVLIIKKATMTNIGDIIALNNGKIIIDSSYITFPQSYFYQLAIILVNKSTATISNSTLDYGGFSHNLSVADTAQISFTNVTQPDWMTTGLSNKASLTMNGTNQAGEFIIADYVNLNIQHATSVILWHQFPDTAVINWSFGTHDTAYGYQFNNTKPGVKGVEYNVSADSCYNIMWAIMPSSSSNVNITNSKIRSIGLWFDAPKDSVIVSGITDNAIYSTFTAPLSDRTLTFTNCTVQTWSFYVFHKSIINVTGCIAGEIGTENKSKMYGNNYVVDGSGGYHWSSDTSTIVANQATITTYARSEATSTFILGYSTVSGSGFASAFDNSLLVVVQTSVPIDPQALGSSDAWFDFIDEPAGNLFADSIAPINGSAWIHRGPTSDWMYFKSWQLFYQPNGDTGWTPITTVDTNEVSNSLLANWNTHALKSGVYNLDLRVNDSWGNEVDAIKQVTLLPLILGVNELNDLSGINIYPNPASQSINISFLSANSKKVKIELTDITGRQVLSSDNYNCISGKNTFLLNTSVLVSGTYICRITDDTGIVQRLVEVSR
jgi:hypothetical protein